MPVTFVNETAVSRTDALRLMGFDIVRLRFYRWLVANGHDPEWDGVGFVSEISTEPPACPVDGQR